MAMAASTAYSAGVTLFQDTPMDGIAAALGAQQSASQEAVSMIALKLAMQNQQRLAELLAQAARMNAVNPAHLGQNIDTYA